MKALKFIKEAESNTEKAKAAAMANIMKQKAEIDAKNAEVKSTKSYDINEPKYDMDEYKSLLSRHDWYYDYSDDHSVWTRGSNERKELNRMQDAIDSDYAIWNEYAPDMFKRIKTAEGESKLPPHLAKLFNPDGTLVNPKAQARWEEIVRKHNTKKKLQNKWKVTDVTPPGYGPADESCGSSHKKKKKVSESDNELEYTGKLHKSIDFTSEHYDDPSFCHDCKLVSITHGKNDEADVLCPRCGSQAYVEASPEQIDKYASPEAWMNEAEGQKPYVCVHAKKGKYECHADTTYGAAKQAAQHWKLKSTAGIDVHLAVESIDEGTDLGQLGNGVLLNQFNMGKGVVGLQITSNKNTGYVHLDLDAAKDLQRKLDQWIGMRDKGELARPGDMDEGFASDAQRKAAFANGYKPKKKKNEGLEESIENLESLTEAQFDEAAGEKDACYHKVKSRYKVWPSAYASGALVQCRKVGAKNWGNKSKK